MKHCSQELIVTCVTIISYSRRMVWSQTRDCQPDITWCFLHSACSSLHNHTLPHFQKLFVQTERSHSSDPSTLHNQQLWSQNNSNKRVIIRNTKPPLVNCINIEAHPSCINLTHSIFMYYEVNTPYCHRGLRLHIGELPFHVPSARHSLLSSPSNM